MQDKIKSPATNRANTSERFLDFSKNPEEFKNYGKNIFKEVKELSQNNILPVLRHLLPQGIKFGGQYVSVNPTRADHKPGSFSINLSNGVWADFATEDKGGDLISLAAYLYKITPLEAAKLIRGILLGPTTNNLNTTSSLSKRLYKNKKDDGSIAICPIPADIAPEIPKPWPGKPGPGWAYTNENGQICFYCVRFRLTNGDKTDRHLTYRQYPDGNRRWALRSIPAPRILFNLHKITSTPEKPIMIAEGEKAAEAAEIIFPEYVVTTSPHGAGSASKADWSPCKDKNIVIWPDNDETGNRYANTVAEILLSQGVASIWIVQIPLSFPQGWDLADNLPAVWTGKNVRELLKTARRAI